jgi:opacity protein-like surface antigen
VIGRSRSVAGLVTVLCWALLPLALDAQTPTTVGFVGGYSRTELVWRPAAETEELAGVVAGAFAHAVTPLGWLSVLAEGTYTQRSGDVLANGPDQPATGGIRSDYLTLSVHGRVSVGLGPVRIHVGAGPTIDQLIRSRLDATLAPVLERETSTVFGAAVGAGLSVLIAGRYTAEAEVRRVEGLGDAYSGGFRSVKNRSTEVVARLGIPLPRG